MEGESDLLNSVLSAAENSDGGGDLAVEIPLEDDPSGATENREPAPTVGVAVPGDVIPDTAYYGPKEVILKGGPCKGVIVMVHLIDADGLLYFPAESPGGRIMQAVYRIELEAQERTAEDKKFGRPIKHEWVGKFVGTRYMLKPMVNGIHKGSAGS